MVLQAESDKKSAVAQARRDSVVKIQNEIAEQRSSYESIIAAEKARLESEKAEKIAQGEQEANQIQESAKNKIKEVNDFLTKEFERAINASS